MIQFLKVSKQYGSSDFALRDVDLAVSRGEFVFVTGPNGAGKSTLLKLICVMERPTSGEVIVEGVSSRAMRRRQVAALRRKTGVILQDLKLLADRTVEENVRLSLEITGAPKETRSQKLVRVLTPLGLLTKRNARPAELSWGQQQKVAVARAIVNQPVLLLADEPTEKLDGAAARTVLETLRDVHLWGTTVICASHNPSLPLEGVTRIVTLENGGIRNDREVDDPAGRVSP
jgi:cell division transport system ATP-binding protein